MPRFKSLPYRPCVGMAVFSRKGRVFIGRRIDGPEHVDDTHAWQLPQGGIDRLGYFGGNRGGMERRADAKG